MKVPKMSEIKRTAKEWGDKFFDADTVVWFDSQLGNKVFQGPGGTFFVTRERPQARKYIYTVRQVDYKEQEIVTAGGHDNFGKYGDWGPAYKAAKRCAIRGIKGGLRDEF